jgi:hypothetical protein
MNPVATIALALLLAASPSTAQVISSPPGDYQVSAVCSFVIESLNSRDGRTPDGQEPMKNRCFGIFIAEVASGSLNIHYTAAHPALPHDPLGTFVIPPGFKGPSLPVSHVAFGIGTKDQLVSDVFSGDCHLKNDKNVPILQCRTVLKGRRGPAYDLLIVGTAGFSEPLSPSILRRFLQ